MHHSDALAELLGSLKAPRYLGDTGKGIEHLVDPLVLELAFKTEVSS